MNELIDKILTAAAIPILIFMGIGIAYFIVQFRRLGAESKFNDFPPDPGPLGNVSDVNVATLGILKIGEVFEFGSTRTIEVNDVIGIKRSPYTMEIYGLAKIIFTDDSGFYKAKRID